MRFHVSRLAPASPLLAACLLAGIAVADEPKPKPPDSVTVGRAPAPIASVPHVTVVPLKPLASTSRAAAPAPRVKAHGPAGSARPADHASLTAEQRAKLAGLAGAAGGAAPSRAGKTPEAATMQPPDKGARMLPPAELQKTRAPGAAPASRAPAATPRGEKPREIVTVGREPATPAPAPSPAQLQKQAGPATGRAPARKPAELSTTRPRDPAAARREKSRAPDTTKREVRP
jgi:hypothetical protein